MRNINITIISSLLYLLCAHPVSARLIDTIIIHHTASADVSAAEIDNWHRERGWDGIGYHYVIRASGAIELGRAVDRVGAHARGRNVGSIGICLTGYDNFTTAQYTALRMLIAQLRKQYNIDRISPHHEQCPGAGFDWGKI